MATDTIVIPGNGTGTISVQLHGPDITDVEAVLAEIDTAGAGDTIATLTATSPTGNDVAAVPQGSPVSGGGQGRATWALRLAEDGGGGAGGATKYEAVIDNAGVLVAPNTVTFLPWFKDFGDDLIGLIGTNQPTLVAAGTYAITVFASGGVAAAAYDLDMELRIPRSGATFQSFVASARWRPAGVSGIGPVIAVAKTFAAGDSLDVQVEHNAAAGVRVSLTAAVAKLA